MFNPSLRRAFLNQPFTQSTSHSRNCSSPKLCSKPSSTNALISQSFSKTLPRTSCAQSFPQPALLSTNNCRNHSSHNRCSKPSSTSVSLDQSRSTPSSPNLCSNLPSTNAFLNHSLVKPFLTQVWPRVFLNQRLSQPLVFQTIPRTIVLQSVPQPALLSTICFRNPSSHSLCSKLSSTSVSLDQSRSTPSSPSLCSQPSSTNAFLNQWLLKSFLAIFCPKLSPATASQTNPSSTDSPLRRPATDSALGRSRPSAETPQRQEAHTPALRRPSAKTPTPQR